MYSAITKKKDMSDILVGIIMFIKACDENNNPKIN
jgi:hypothetical protein